VEPFSLTTQKRFIVRGIFLTLFLLFIAALFFTPLLKLAGMRDTTQLFILSRLFIYLCLFIILAYSVKIEKQHFLIWTEKKYAISYYFISMVALMLILFANGIVLVAGLKLSGLYEVSKKFNEINQIMHGHTLLIVFTALTAGITEELIFRGYLLPRLALIFKKAYLSIVISSVLFGLLHISYGTLAQIIITGFIGLIFAIHYYKYRNIKIIIACHFLWDLLILLVQAR